MERPCYQCGLVIDDLRTFCPQCQAPQIRVISTIPAPQPVAISVLRRAKLPRRSRVDWWNAFPAAILAVLIVALFNRGDFGALGLFLCSAACVVLYRQRNKTIGITRWVGAQLGAIAGILAVAIMFVSQWAQLKPLLQQAATQSLQQTLARSGDPAAKQALQDFVTQYPNSFFVLGIVVMILVLLVISTLAGAISASLLRRWRPEVHFASSEETKLEQSEKTEHSEHD